MVDFVQEKDIMGYEKFPISVEINPHLDDVWTIWCYGNRNCSYVR